MVKLKERHAIISIVQVLKKKTRATNPWNFPGPVWKLPHIGQPERFGEYSVSHLIVIDISQKYFLVSFLLLCRYLEINHCTNLPDLRCINFESGINYESCMNCLTLNWTLLPRRSSALVSPKFGSFRKVLFLVLLRWVLIELLYAGCFQITFV